MPGFRITAAKREKLMGGLAPLQARLARRSGLAKAVRPGAANVRPAESVVSPNVKQVTFDRWVRRYR